MITRQIMAPFARFLLRPLLIRNSLKTRVHIWRNFNYEAYLCKFCRTRRIGKYRRLFSFYPLPLLYLQCTCWKYLSFVCNKFTLIKDTIVEYDNSQSLLTRILLPLRCARATRSFPAARLFATEFRSAFFAGLCAAFGSFCSDGHLVENLQSGGRGAFERGGWIDDAGGERQVGSRLSRVESGAGRHEERVERRAVWTARSDPTARVVVELVAHVEVQVA